ncbi:gamma-glutamylcyclotransferase family protein [Streptomyces sp. NPDC101062]|uniref:gamma-glutamylcyclotransferase family protein n=1 Tax=unclassified Streptomyces TaxID=2593676 RepID=UPI003805D9AB
MSRTMSQIETAPAAPARLDQLVAGHNALFVYGTLQFDAVLTALLGRIPPGRPVSAPGWRAAALDNRLYPGLVATAPGTEAAGLLLTDLSREEWAVLDAFEDDLYDLREVTLASGERGWSYVWTAGEVRDDDWDTDTFASFHLQQYAARCRRISARPAPDIRGATSTTPTRKADRLQRGNEPISPAPPGRCG